MLSLAPADDLRTVLRLFLEEKKQTSVKYTWGLGEYTASIVEGSKLNPVPDAGVHTIVV